MTTKLVLFLTLAIGVFGQSPMLASAQRAADIRIVDMQRLMSESIVGKAARNNIEGEVKKRQAALGAKKMEIDRLKADLDKQAAVLSAAAVEEKRGAFEKTVRDFERTVQDQREEVDRKKASEIGRVVAQIREVVKEMAAQKKYSFILENDTQSVIYSDASLDITDEVLKLLDSKKIGI